MPSRIALSRLRQRRGDEGSRGLLICGAGQDLTYDVWWPLAGTVTAMFLLIDGLCVLGDALDPRVD